MIKIKQSKTADTRSCDPATVSKEVLTASSLQHIQDVGKALAFFQMILTAKAAEHDYDKLTTIDAFHECFKGGFKDTSWWDKHRRMHRHHIDKADGCPPDVNLLDVLEHIADCVMAGKARTGTVFPLKLSDELLQKAFQNTVALLSNEVEVEAVEKLVEPELPKKESKPLQEYFTLKDGDILQPGDQRWNEKYNIWLNLEGKFVLGARYEAKLHGTVRRKV